ncbi:MAG: M14 family zinc carboxypeptidase [Phycisphaerales bacterium]
MMIRLIPLGLVLISAPAGFVGAGDSVAAEFHEFTRWNDDDRYGGRCVVRVRTTSEHQLEQVLRLAHDVWSERIGQGTLEIDIRKDRLRDLVAIGVPYDVLIDDLQAHADRHEREMLDVRTAQQAGSLSDFQRGGQIHNEDWFETYRTLDEITSYITNIETLRADLATVDVVGQTWEGRDMFSVTISGPDSAENPREERPALFIFSTVHAREWIAPMTTSYIASRLASDYDTDPHVKMLLDNARVVIVPVGNPDGYLYTWSNERYWRNTRRDNGDGTFGVNINRNWAYQWGYEGASPNTSNTNYRGTHPFSEPETRALRDIALGLGDKLVAHIDYHSYSQLVMWPFGYASHVVTPEPWESALEHIGTCMSNEIMDSTGAFYVPQQSVNLYPAAGNSQDWFFGALSSVSMLVELRPSHPDFSPPPNQIRPCAQENYAAFKVMIEKTALGDLLLHQEQPERDLSDQTAAELVAFTDTGELEASNIVLHARIGSSDQFSQYPVEAVGRRLFTGQLPGAGCGNTVQYYFTVQMDDGETVTLPEGGAAQPYESVYVSRAMTLFSAAEADRGWVAGLPDDTATSGQWERAVPEGTSYQPGADHSPGGTMCWVTDARAGTDADEFDVDGGETTLVSPRFSALEESVLKFWIWQNPSLERQDISRVWISNDDGASWTFLPFVWSTTPRHWEQRTYTLSDHIEPTNTMRIRFTVRDVREDSTVELAIDDISVGIAGCPVNAADINGDGRLNIFDVSLFIEFFNADSMSADYNADSEIDFFDISAFLKLLLED